MARFHSTWSIANHLVDVSGRLYSELGERPRAEEIANLRNVVQSHQSVLARAEQLLQLLEDPFDLR